MEVMSLRVDGENVFMRCLGPDSGALSVIGKFPHSGDLGVRFPTLPSQVPSVLLLVVSVAGTLDRSVWQRT